MSCELGPPSKPAPGPSHHPGSTVSQSSLFPRSPGLDLLVSQSSSAGREILVCSGDLWEFVGICGIPLRPFPDPPRTRPVGSVFLVSLLRPDLGLASLYVSLGLSSRLSLVVWVLLSCLLSSLLGKETIGLNIWWRNFL